MIAILILITLIVIYLIKKTEYYHNIGVNECGKLGHRLPDCNQCPCDKAVIPCMECLDNITTCIRCSTFRSKADIIKYSKEYLNRLGTRGK